MALLKKTIESLGLWSSIYLPLRKQDEGFDLPSLRIWDGRQCFPLYYATTLNEQRKLLLVQAVDWTHAPVMFALGELPRNLSSGELAMLRFVAQAVGAAERACIFLFDEPETHLHPNFISEFMDTLNHLLSATQSVAIIATHSAYIVREVPRQHVRVISKIAKCPLMSLASKRSAQALIVFRNSYFQIQIYHIATNTDLRSGWRN
jgi:hypothetical protein